MPVPNESHDVHDEAAAPATAEGVPVREDVAQEDGNTDTGTTNLQDQVERLEQRYRSLVGVMRSKDAQIEQLQQLIATMQASADNTEAQAQKQQTNKNVSDLVTSSDRTAIGDETVDFVTRIVNEAVRGVVSDFERRLRTLEGGVQDAKQMSGASAQATFTRELTALVPDWERLNVDPDFMMWLEQSPSRQNGFSAAAQAFDPAGVAVYFNAYKAETGHGQPKKQTKQPKVSHSRPAPQPEATADNSQGQKVWTRAEIADFYANGRSKYSPDEYKRIEKEIFAASREGRVQ